jgi:hypothetical protein
MTATACPLIGNIHGFRRRLEDSRVEGPGFLTSRQDLIPDEVQFFGLGVKGAYDEDKTFHETKDAKRIAS